MPGFTDAGSAMDFAIAAVRRGDPGAGRSAPNAGSDVAGSGDAKSGDEWAVLCLHTRRGVEVAQHLARFGHRSHAEAFLSDLLATAAGRPTGPDVQDGRQ